MSDDLISRQELLKKLNELDQQELYLPCHFKECVIDEVSNIPQKTGQWIERVDERGDVYYECSNCEEAFTLREGTPADNLYNHCPNCGAEMEIDSNEQLLS